MLCQLLRKQPSYIIKPSSISLSWPWRRAAQIFLQVRTCYREYIVGWQPPSSESTTAFIPTPRSYLAGCTLSMTKHRGHTGAGSYVLNTGHWWTISALGPPVAWPTHAQNFTVVWGPPYPTLLLSPSLFTGVTPASVGSLWIPVPTCLPFTGFSLMSLVLQILSWWLLLRRPSLTRSSSIFPWIYYSQLEFTVFKTKLKRLLQNLAQNIVDQVRAILELRLVVRRGKWHWKPPPGTEHSTSSRPEHLC